MKQRSEIRIQIEEFLKSAGKPVTATDIQINTKAHKSLISKYVTDFIREGKVRIEGARGPAKCFRYVE